MAVWFGGVRLPPDKSVKFLDEQSGSFALFTPTEQGDVRLTLHIWGRSGRAVLESERTICPLDDFEEAADGARLSVKPMPFPQTENPQAAKHDVLVALIGFDSKGQQVFEVGHDAMRTHRAMKIQIL